MVQDSRSVLHCVQFAQGDSDDGAQIRAVHTPVDRPEDLGNVRQPLGIILLAQGPVLRFEITFPDKPADEGAHQISIFAESDRPHCCPL